MSEIIKPLFLDETGKAIVEALTQREMTKTRIAEINAAADAAKSGIETKTDEQVARITEVTALAEDVNQLKGDFENIQRASYNLFDIDNADIKQASVTVNFTYDLNARSIVFPCVSGKTYRISRKNSTKRLNVNFTSEYPDIHGTELLKDTMYIPPYTHAVVNAPDNAKYMVIMFYHANYDADYNATLEEFMIHEGSEWRPYVPHLVSNLTDAKMCSEMRSLWMDRIQSTPMFSRIVQNHDSQCTIADGHILYSGSWSENGGIINKYDVSIECSPNLLATIPISPRHQVNGIAQNDGYLYIVTRENKGGAATWEDSTYGGSLVIIDKQTFHIVNTIEYPKNPYTENSNTAYFGKASGLAIYENLMAVNLQLEGWILYDITDNTNPVQLYKLDVRSTWHSSMPKKEYQKGQFFKVNDKLYYAVCGYEDGMYVYDLSNTSSPVQVAFFNIKNTYYDYNKSPFEMHTFGIYVDYPYAYITLAPSDAYYFHEYRRLGIATIDMSDFNNLTFTSSFIDDCDRPNDYRALDSCPTNVVKIGNKLAINIDSSGIGIFTIDDPKKPVYRGRIYTGTRINGLYASDDGRLIATPQYDRTRPGCIYIFRGV